MWNKAYDDLKLELGEDKLTWFKGPWLYAECYMYRRIREAMLLCKSPLSQYDPFEKAKLEAHELSLKSVCQLITSLCPLNYSDEKNKPDLMRHRFNICMEALLWANKNDLSLSSGNDVSSKVKNLVDLLESFKSNILCDHSDELWRFLNELKKKKLSSNGPVCIDIILDNCSIELASDLIISDFLLRNDFVDKITLHAKAYSWFISDVTKHDFDHLIRQLQSSNSLIINNFLKRLDSYMNVEQRLVLEHENPFWTSPYSFDKMEKISPELYTYFKQNSSLVFLKGDLNYRKLIGDLNWPFETPLANAIRGFRPTSLCAVRTLKSDIISNLDTNEATNENFALVKKQLGNSDKWMTTGDYGIIQFAQIEN